MANGYTYGQVAFDIEKTLKQNFTDADVNMSSILYWMSVTFYRLKTQRLNNNLKETNRIAGSYLSVFDSVPILTAIDAGNPNRHDKYIVSPDNILDLDRDRGIEYISYSEADPDCIYGPGFTRLHFTLTTPAEAQRLYYRASERPSPTNPYYYRKNVGQGTASEEKRIYLLGLEKVNIKLLEIGVYRAKVFSEIEDIGSTSGMDMVIDLPSDLIEQAIFDILNMGRFALMMPRDRKNDGTDIANQPAFTNAQKMSNPSISQIPEENNGASQS